MFISMDGVDGSGKTTQLRYLHDYLLDRGHKVMATREPGGSSVGEKLRNILIDPDIDISNRTQLLLMLADRVHHIEDVILPALLDNKIVLCDRYHDSTRAYQLFTRGLEEREHIAPAVQSFIIKPDITILVRVEADEAMNRIVRRGEALSRYEAKGSGYLNKLVEAFDSFAKEEPDRWIVVDGMLKASEVHKSIILEFKKRKLL